MPLAVSASSPIDPSELWTLQLAGCLFSSSFPGFPPRATHVQCCGSSVNYTQYTPLLCSAIDVCTTLLLLYLYQQSPVNT
jgi:hypothetical protein